MANRAFQQFQGTLLKKTVKLYATVSIGGTGACTLKKWNPTAVGGASARSYTSAPTATGTSPYQTGEGGIKSIARTGTGAYTLTLQDTYQRLLGFKVTMLNATGSLAAPLVGVLDATDVTATTPVIKFLCMSAASTAADPASGDTLLIEVDLHDASEM